MNASSPATLKEYSSASLRGLWLWLARLAWLLVLLANLVLIYFLMPRTPTALFLDPIFKNSFRAVQGLLSLNAYGWYVLVIYYLVLLTFLLVGVFIAWRRSSDWMALLTSATLITMGVRFGQTSAYETAYNVLPGYDWLVSFDQIIELGSVLGMLLLIYLFPDGRVIPRRLGWAVAAILAVVIAIAFSPIDQTYMWPATVLGAVLLLVGGITSQVYRYRRVSTPLQRQQTKWAVFGFLIYPLFVFTLGAFLAFLPSDQRHPLWDLLYLHMTVLTLLLIPLTLSISILRYRLWDIDVIVRRTLIYGALSLTLGAIFLSSVALLQMAFSRVTGERSAVATVISTLLIAALFNPLRKRIQTDIDRRFYRRKYNAEQVIERFAAKARQETDLEQLTAELLAVVQETMQPQNVSLWMLPQKKKD